MRASEATLGQGKPPDIELLQFKDADLLGDSGSHRELAGRHDFHMLYHAPTAVVQSVRSLLFLSEVPQKYVCQGGKLVLHPPACFHTLP